MKFVNTINAILDTTLKTIMAISTASVLVISFIQIISRFVMQLPIGWSTDILRLSFIYAVFSGAALCAKKADHINLDILLSLLSAKKRIVAETIIMIVVCIFCVFLTRIGYDYTISGLTQKAPFTSLTMAVYYAAIPCCTAIMTFYYLQLVIHNIATLLLGRRGEERI